MEPREVITDIKRRNLDKSIMEDHRSENRKSFLTIPLTDPRQKLVEQQITAAKERRQKNFKETRENKNNEEIKETKLPENPNNKQLAQIVKQLTETLKQFEITTRKEIENIRKQIDLKIRIKDKENENLAKITESFENKLEEIKQLIPSHVNESIKERSTQIKNYYVHNQNRFKNGLAMLKEGENKFTRVPLIPKYKYDRYSRKWTTEYFVQSMTECISFEKFLKKNINIIIYGRRNIIQAKSKHDKIKKENMEEYRRKLKILQEQRETNMEI